MLQASANLIKTRNLYLLIVLFKKRALSLFRKCRVLLYDFFLTAKEKQNFHENF